MLKGKSVIELTNVHTGKKEHYEDTNLVTEAAMDILNCNIKGMLYNNTTFNGTSGDDWMLPLKKNIMGGILLYQNALEERADNIYAPLNNPLIGYASDDANNTEDIRRGSRNLTESKEVDGGYRFVWDFATSQANGTISAICLSNTLAGKGTQYAGNYMVRIGTLVSYTKLSPNHSGQRTHSIDRITPHCVVGQLSAESICGCFTSPSRQASCNYGIGTDGRISLCIEEKNRSWCSSSNANDQRAITIECASDMSEPYAMNDKVYASVTGSRMARQ